MGFKADTSFLRFLTMGARGVHQTMAQLKGLGFKPIELERYCGSNKIWATKVKRLRLPDLLCVKTGARFEVRAKSDLAIKMSDAPDNPDRVWDAGLQDDDLAAFIACSNGEDGYPIPADEAMFFRVADMRSCVGMSKLGPPKSASEGAERDRTWPATIPSRNGVVLEVTTDRIVVQMDATDSQAARRQTYQLRGKTPYANAGDRFKKGVCFLSGAPNNMANLPSYLGRTYDPFRGLVSAHAVDRYSAVKSFPYRDDDRRNVIEALERCIKSEQEDRIKLEAAGSATFFGSELGQDTITEFVWGEDVAHELRMETVLILTELGDGEFTKNMLSAIAGHRELTGDERRQAAIWGLGKAGHKSYSEILPYIADEKRTECCPACHSCL